MKKMRKTIGALLAVVMVICMSVAALAATVTIPEALTGHTFKAYQIFEGHQGDGQELADIDWGNGINKDNFLNALKGYQAGETKPFENCTSATDVANVLTGDQGTALPQAVANLADIHKSETATEIKAGSTELEPGYYLIVDVTKVGEGDALNKTLLYVTGNNVPINVKTDKPKVEKKVLENSNKYDTDGGYGAGYNDVADYNIGDDVPFKLIGTIPDMTHYDTYKYIFHDTLSNGLTYNTNSLKVYIVDSQNANLTTPLGESNYIVTSSRDNLEIKFENLKSVTSATKGKFIIVTYTAKLNENAVIGLDGNDNKVNLEYSNNPNNSESTGHTPDDKVIVFTYELDVTKVDGGTPSIKLEGAQFKLKKSETEWLTVDNNGKVTGWAESETKASTLTSGEDGLIRIIGLDDGTYYLKETKAPAGYNTPSSDFIIVISATTVNNQAWNGTASAALTDLTIKVDNDNEASTQDEKKGVVSATIKNNKGATLPSTGGMGTKIFYTLGGIAVLYAGVKLITRRRMRNMQ